MAKGRPPCRTRTTGLLRAKMASARSVWGGERARLERSPFSPSEFHAAPRVRMIVSDERARERALSRGEERSTGFQKRRIWALREFWFASFW